VKASFVAVAPLLDPDEEVALSAEPSAVKLALLAPVVQPQSQVSSDTHRSARRQ
jgi:hypothetical protein